MLDARRHLIWWGGVPHFILGWKHILLLYCHQHTLVVCDMNRPFSDPPQTYPPILKSLMPPRPLLLSSIADFAIISSPPLCTRGRFVISSAASKICTHHLQI